MWILAWRNLWRHRRRTITVGTAIAASYALFLVILSIEDHSHLVMQETAERTIGGALRVEGAGFTATRNLEHHVPAGEALAAELLAHPEVRAVRVEVELSGLLSSPRNNAGAQIRGVDVEAWPEVLDDLFLSVGEGAFLDPGDPQGIALARPVARDLQVGLGDRVVLTLSDPEGEVTRALFHVGSILEVQVGGPEQIAFLRIEAAQQAAGLEDGVTGIGLSLADSDDRFALRGDVQAQVDALRPGEGLAVLTWDEVVPDLIAIIEIDRAFTLIVLALVFLVVVFAIANTMMMSVMERTRELGLLGALGLGPWATARLVLYESVAKSAVFMGIGFVLAVIAHLAISRWGIPVGETGFDYDVGDIQIVEPILYSHINPDSWIFATLLIFGLTTLAALHPAVRAARLQPTEAMRQWK
jgi:ABC-type lipoprotein release transport system permease subunit